MQSATVSDNESGSTGETTIEIERMPAERLNHSFWVIAIPAGLGLTWCIQWAFQVGFGKLNPNVINLFMLSFGLALHGSARAYLNSTQNAVQSCSGIILQYPLYAGIMGIMFASGIVQAIGTWMSGFGPIGLAVSTFYSGGFRISSCRLAADNGLYNEYRDESSSRSQCEAGDHSDGARVWGSMDEF